jgi:hypothetical protein
MAVITDRCPGIQMTVVDLNAERIAAWNDPDRCAPCTAAAGECQQGAAGEDQRP